jgi:hypothetical protein
MPGTGIFARGYLPAMEDWLWGENAFGVTGEAYINDVFDGGPRYLSKN